MAQAPTSEAVEVEEGLVDEEAVGLGVSFWLKFLSCRTRD